MLQEQGQRIRTGWNGKETDKQKNAMKVSMEER